MKIYHFIMVFTIIFIVIVVITDINTNDFKKVVMNKEQIDTNLDVAIDDGTTNLVQVDNSNNLIINKDSAIQSFYMSLDSTFGVLSDQEKKQLLNLYIPVILISEEDGYYVFYSDFYTASDGNKYVSQRWSEKRPYYFEDSDFIYGFTQSDAVMIYDKNKLLDPSGVQKVFNLDYHDFKIKAEFASFRVSRPSSLLLSDVAFLSIRKSVLLSSIENSMAFYTSRHNRIAVQYGISYNFALPSVSEAEWEPYLDDVSMFVVFQGYPYGDASGETYNRVASAGAKVTKSNVYYIEQKSWYKIYHYSDCAELQKATTIIWDEPYYNEEQCIKDGGCFGCPICIKNGAYAPDYTP